MPVDPRLEELLDRMVAPGLCLGLSCPEVVELVDKVRLVLTEYDALRAALADIRRAQVAAEQGRRLEDSHARLRETLAQVQWCRKGYCPWCKSFPAYGHEPWCVIGKAMRGAS